MTNTGEDVEMRNSTSLLVGVEIGAVAVESGWGRSESPTRTALQPSHTTPGHLPRGLHILRILHIVCIFCGSIDNSKKMNQSSCPSKGEWIIKLWFMHTMGFYWAEKKYEAFQKWTDFQRGSPISERQRAQVLVPMLILDLTFYMCVFMWSECVQRSGN